MSGATTELNLATAVDSDDNADYLTLSLANSLRTVDALFNNVTGHTHGGAHQGGPVAIPDGSIQAVDIADGAVTNAKLASDTARANLLTNGGFEIWQRGNGPFAGGAFCADRWQTYNPGGTVSVSKDTANTDLAAGVGMCAAIVSTAPASIGNGMYQIIDANYDMLSMRGRQVTVSVRVKCSQANSVRVGLEGDKGVAGPSVWSSYHPGGGVYATLTATLTLGIVNGLTVWITGLVAGTWYLDNAMLVVGSVPADYAPLHPADDLARCLRYYEVAQNVRNAGYGVGGSQLEWWTPFRVIKPVSPTITLSAQSNLNFSAVSSAFTNNTGVDLYGTVTAVGTGQMSVTCTTEANP